MVYMAQLSPCSSRAKTPEAGAKPLNLRSFSVTSQTQKKGAPRIFPPKDIQRFSVGGPAKNQQKQSKLGAMGPSVSISFLVNGCQHRIYYSHPCRMRFTSTELNEDFQLLSMGLLEAGRFHLESRNFLPALPTRPSPKPLPQPAAPQKTKDERSLGHICLITRRVDVEDILSVILSIKQP